MSSPSRPVETVDWELNMLIAENNKILLLKQCIAANRLITISRQVHTDHSHRMI